MKAKSMISLVVAVGFIAAFTVCPAFAASGDVYGSTPYVASQKDHNLITGTIDYLGSVVEVFSKGTWETFDSVMAIPPKCCKDRDTYYRPVITMNRGGRWTRGYRR